MIMYPVVRYDARVEVAHHALPNIINTVLIMLLVQLRKVSDLLLYVRE